MHPTPWFQHRPPEATPGVWLLLSCMVHHYQGILLFKLNMPLPVNSVCFHLDVEYRPCLTQNAKTPSPSSSPSGYRTDRVDASSPEFPEISGAYRLCAPVSHHSAWDGPGAPFAPQCGAMRMRIPWGMMIRIDRVRIRKQVLSVLTALQSRRRLAILHQGI